MYLLLQTIKNFKLNKLDKVLNTTVYTFINNHRNATLKDESP